MLRNLFIKEWKERRPVFFLALALLLAFVGSFLGFTENKEARDLLTGAATLVFPPVLGLLLGSSAFYSEFKDGAWAYLFSRPVKKWQIWLAKYVSLLSILLAVAIVFSLLVEIVPGVKDVLGDLSFNLRFGRQLSLFSLGLIWSLILFTTSFSLAILSERQPTILFLSLLLWACLYAGFFLVYSSPLQIWMHRVFLPGLISIVGLFGFSLAVASLLTFSRADFSQPKKKAWHFTKLAGVFIAASCVISVGIIMAFSRAGSLSRISDLEISGRAVFFHSGKGIYKYDLESRRLRRIGKTYLWAPLSVGGNRIVFVKEVLQSGNRMFTDLWIADIDGQHARPLLETSHEGSPFYNLLIWGAEVTSDGRKIAFLARDNRNQHTFCWMNGDGSKIRSLPLDMPQIRFIRLIGFSGSTDKVVLQCIRQVRMAESGASLLSIDLIQATVETLAANVRKPHLAALSGKDLAVYIAFDEARGQEVLHIHDLQTGEKTEVVAADSIAAFSWTEAGDKLGVWTGKANLSIYSPAEKRVVAERDMKGHDIGLPLLALNGEPSEGALIICRTQRGEKMICVLDDQLNEIKAIPLPWVTGDGLRLEAAGEVIFAREYDKRQLWTLDLETEKWSRIY